jgi:IclR family transcriptional regulator, KDG regulon repressor
MKKLAEEESKGNRAVIKALEILEYMGDTKEPAHLKELAVALDLPESTTHRLLSSLLSMNFVQQSDIDNRYNLGWKFITLANSLGITGQLPQLLSIHLRHLANEVKKSVNLSILVGKNVVYLDSYSPTSTRSIYSPPGSTVPAYASAVGKAQLAYKSNDVIKKLFPSDALIKYTNSTICSTEALLSELGKVRNLGYALDVGEYDSNIYCVGAPIFDSLGTLIAGISISAFLPDLPPDWYVELIPSLLGTCKTISTEL